MKELRDRKDLTIHDDTSASCQGIVGLFHPDGDLTITPSPCPLEPDSLRHHSGGVVAVTPPHSPLKPDSRYVNGARRGSTHHGWCGSG